MIKNSIRHMTDEQLAEALRANGNNVTRTAAALNIWPAPLFYRIDRNPALRAVASNRPGRPRRNTAAVAVHSPPSAFLRLKALEAKHKAHMDAYHNERAALLEAAKAEAAEVLGEL